MGTPKMDLPDDIRESLDTVEQSLGELLYLRRVVESIKAEDPQLLERHANKVAGKLGLRWELSDRCPELAPTTLTGQYLLLLRGLALADGDDRFAYYGPKPIAEQLGLDSISESRIRRELRIEGLLEATTDNGAHPLVRLSDAGWTLTDKWEH